MKVAVIYASTTGNTEVMAKAICESAKEKGAEVVFKTADTADASEVSSCDLIFLGSPAMGDEILEDSMEDFYTQLEPSLNGKKTALFGSYDWGDGQWLRDWEERVSSAGSTVVNEPLKIQLTPDEEGISQCKSWASEAI